MKIDAVGVALVAGEEGKILHPYDDHDVHRLTYDTVSGRYHRQDGTAPIGFPTIGIGHLIRPGQAFEDITDERATTAIFLDDLADVEAAINRCIPDDTDGWNQNRYNAVCDACFNLGALWAFRSGLAAACVAGKYDDCRAIFAKYVHSQGAVLPVLVRRRAREWALFSTPVAIAWGPNDVANILASVHTTALDSVDEFTKGSPLPDEDEVPDTDRNS